MRATIGVTFMIIGWCMAYTDWIAGVLVWAVGMVIFSSNSKKKPNKDGTST